MAHNGSDPGEREPLGIYWYEYRPAKDGSIEWIKHIVDYGGRAGAGMQIEVADLNGDGDLDLAMGGKPSCFCSRICRKRQRRGDRPTDAAGYWTASSLLRAVLPGDSCPNQDQRW